MQLGHYDETEPGTVQLAVTHQPVCSVVWCHPVYFEPEGILQLLFKNLSLLTPLIASRITLPATFIAVLNSDLVELINFFCVFVFAGVMLLSPKGYYSMSPYDDGYVSLLSFIFTSCHCSFPHTSHLVLTSSSYSSPPSLYVCSLRLLYFLLPFVLSLNSLP